MSNRQPCLGVFLSDVSSSKSEPEIEHHDWKAQVLANQLDVELH